MSYTGFVQGSETTLQSTYSDTSAQPTCDYGYGTWNSGTNRGMTLMSPATRGPS
uniref:A-kinase anchoring protein 8 like n=1 Tax=Homo sapiens TaxID=9606 RepID=A0A7P0T8N3_HUMAN